MATCTPEVPLPNVAATVAHRLGIAAPGAYDLNAACAGFCYALGAASDAVRAGSRAERAGDRRGEDDLVDRLDRPVDLHHLRRRRGRGRGRPDRARRAAGHRPGGLGLGGRPGDKITVTGRTGALTQDGQAVFRWATTAMAPVALEACRRAGVTPADITAFVPHQANLRIIEAIARRLGIPRDRVADDIIHAGNTSSASIPLALSRMAEQGRLQPGTPALLSGSAPGCPTRRR